MIEPALTSTCWVRRRWHQDRRSAFELRRNRSDRCGERCTEWPSESGHAVKLQRAQRRIKTICVRAHGCRGAHALRWWVERRSTWREQRRAAAGAEERSFIAAGAASLGRDEVEDRRGGARECREQIVERGAKRHPRRVKRGAYRARTMVGMSTPSGCTVSAAPLATIPVADWERLLAMNPAASAFSQRAVHDAWWSGYGDGAEDISLVVRNGAGAICGYLPLMRRPDGVRYLGATFHIDYATVLLDLSPSGCAREAVEALVAALYADPSPLDLRRLRRADPAHSLLHDALTAGPANAPDTARAATVSVEEPAPSIDLHGITSLDAHLERIDKKDRHEIRRKVRRGEAAGVTITTHANTVEALDEFMRLHRARWGERGLFTATEAGARDERFMRALFAAAPEHLITVLIAQNAEFGAFAAGLYLRDAQGLRYWNAGGDAAARALSPGILLFVAGLELAISEGKQAFDFLRGNESYKYEVGATDSDVLQVHVAGATA